MINEEALKGVILDVKKKAIDGGHEIIWSTRGGSMSPILRTNSRIIITKCSEKDFRPGDIILYESQSKKLVAHRFIKRIRANGSHLFLTKGDTSFNYDRPFAIDAVVGRVTKIKRPRFTMYLDTSLGRFINIVMLIFSVARITPLGIDIFRKIKRLAKKNHINPISTLRANVSES